MSHDPYKQKFYDPDKHTGRPVHGEMKHLYLKDINNERSRVKIYRDGGVQIITFTKFKGRESVSGELGIKPYIVQEIIDSLKEWDSGLYDKFHEEKA